MENAPIVDLLEFAIVENPPHFSGATDVEIFIEDESSELVEGQWREVWTTPDSMLSLVDGLQSGRIDLDDVRMSDQDKLYLDCLFRFDIGDDLLHDSRITKSRLIALAEAGYTRTDDLLSDDVVDIGHNTGIDRDLIAAIATDYLSTGFSTQSLGVDGQEDQGPLADISPQDDFSGWDVVHQSSNRIEWASRGWFTVTVTPNPTGGCVIKANAPDEKRHSWYRKGFQVDCGDDNQYSGDEAVERAHEWLTENQLVFKEDLAQIKYIGPATKDYLELNYGISSREGLKQLLVEDTEEFTNIFGDEVASEIKDAIVDVDSSPHNSIEFELEASV